MEGWVKGAGMKQRWGRGKYSATNIFRRCGQLGILYADVVDSVYCRERGIQSGKYELAYQEGIEGTIDWGQNKRDVVVGEDVLSCNKDEMIEFLAKSSRKS